MDGLPVVRRMPAKKNPAKLTKQLLVIWNQSPLLKMPATPLNILALVVTNRLRNAEVCAVDISFCIVTPCGVVGHERESKDYCLRE